MTFTYASNPEPGTAFILSRWVIGFAILVVFEILMYRGYARADKTSTKGGPTKSMWLNLMLTYGAGFLGVTVITGISTGWNFVWKIIG